MSHTKTTSDVSVAHDLIITTASYRELCKKFEEKDAILGCLYGLGLDISRITEDYGFIRLANNRTTGYNGKLYIGKTRADFEMKHIWETIDVLAPEKLPAGKTLINIEALGEDEQEESMSLDEIKEAQDFDKRTTQKRQVRTPKYYVPSTDQFIKRNLNK